MWLIFLLFCALDLMVMGKANSCEGKGLERDGERQKRVGLSERERERQTHTDRQAQLRDQQGQASGDFSSGIRGR